MKPREDNDDRKQIRTDLNINLLVEAAAGTGKTYSLVERITELIRTGTASIPEIAAVTFTRKAASELRTKLADKLDELCKSASGENLSRLEHARDALDQAFLGTIHSFCARLIRERPVEAGIAPDFLESDRDEAAILAAEVWQEHLEKLYRESGPTLERLKKLQIDPGQLQRAFRTVVEYPDLVAARNDVSAPDLSEALDAANRFLDGIMAILVTLGRAEAPDELAAAAWDADSFRQNHDLRDGANAAALLSILRSAKTTQKNWPTLGMGKKFSDLARSLQADSIVPALERWFEHCHSAVIDTIIPAADKLRSTRIELARPDFTDLLILCRDMLRDRPSVREHLQDRFSRLLVDEFQDTDPLQAEVMFFLTGKDLKEKDWMKLRPGAGSLFVVGDPKQSIYRFRRADINVYQQVRSRIEETGGSVLHLSTSFRSAPAICDAVNQVFAPQFGTAPTYQPAYVPLKPSRAVDAKILTGAFRLVSRVAGRKERPVWDADSGAIASWIASSINEKRMISEPKDGHEIERPVEASDFLVILSRAAKLDTYARALEREGIPAAVMGGKAYGGSEEVRALLPILEAIADPDNPIPFVAFLRGLFCGVDDDTLYRFKKSGGRFSYRTQPPESADQRIRLAIAQLRSAEEVVRTLPPGAAIGRIAEDLGILAGAYADENGDRRAGNIAKTLIEAHRLSADGRSFAEIVSGLRELVDEGEAPEMSIDPAMESSVRITNLHKAKGLEAPIVFLAGPLPDQGHHPVESWIDRDKNPASGRFRILDDQNREIARPLGWNGAEAEERAQMDAEQVRRLYVAATRAMNLLVVSGVSNPDAMKPHVRYGPWSDIAEGLAEGELDDLPLLPPAAVTRHAESVPTGSEIAAARTSIVERRSKALVPSYAAASPSKFEAKEVFVLRERTGKGMSWGRVLHRLLDALMRDRSDAIAIENLAADLLREEERPAEELTELLLVIDGVRASDVWQRARHSPRCLTEVPFAAVVRSADYGLPDPPETTLLNGSIDLAFKEKDVWKLIDYKSDKIVGAVEPLVERYKPQILAYRAAWKQLTREPAEAGFCFLDDPNRIVWIP